jgi:hypothetical protein
MLTFAISQVLAASNNFYPTFVRHSQESTNRLQIAASPCITQQDRLGKSFEINQEHSAIRIRIYPQTLDDTNVEHLAAFIAFLQGADFPI